MNLEGDLDGPVNLGNPFEITISELAQLIISLVGSRSRLEFRPLPQDDPRQRCPDITRAEQFLHWSPKVPLKEGLSRTIRYFDSLLSSPNEARRLIWKVAV
jgi:UDP-glucuronate decarboxylase